MISINKTSKVWKWIMVSTGLILLIFLIMYTGSYLKPLSFLREKFNEYHIVTDNALSDYEFVERSVVKEMVERSETENGNQEFINKYKRILVLPSPFFIMSDYQRIELTLGAYDDDPVDEICAMWKNKKLSVTGFQIATKSL